MTWLTWTVKLVAPFAALFWATPGYAQSYTTPGTYSFVVPKGITQLQLTLSGGGGGGGGADYQSPAGAGASGARITAAINVTAGQTVTIIVASGGRGGFAAGDPGFGLAGPCTGGGAGGMGYAAGGAGAAVNCARVFPYLSESKGIPRRADL